MAKGLYCGGNCKCSVTNYFTLIARRVTDPRSELPHSVIGLVERVLGNERGFRATTSIYIYFGLSLTVVPISPNVKRRSY